MRRECCDGEGTLCNGVTVTCELINTYGYCASPDLNHSITGNHSHAVATSVPAMDPDTAVKNVTNIFVAVA
jgi:hypothetical protein